MIKWYENYFPVSSVGISEHFKTFAYMQVQRGASHFQNSTHAGVVVYTMFQINIVIRQEKQPLNPGKTISTSIIFQGPT
jgi:hypothetical protein